MQEDFVEISPLSNFVYLRTYARWIAELGRREVTWDETVERYIQWVTGRRDVPDRIVHLMRKHFLEMGVLPSMRAMWSAGEAADRDNCTLYNCSFLPIDNLRAFSEALYILMCGTGVGFSVESIFVDNLPVVQAERSETKTVVVEDSTEGWADGLFEVLTAAWQGYAVKYDVSKLRARGAILKTKGGRASGPEPLVNLFDLCLSILNAARGWRLRPIEVHDIMCTIGEIVMVGGFRRAALISFSDVHDVEMRHAKDWSLGDFPKCRYMANNSSYYTTRPSRNVFDAEWGALVSSRAGERGFYTIPPSKRNVRSGDCRSNPCVTGSTWVNTDQGPRQVSEIIGTPFTAVVDGAAYPSTDAGFWSTGVKPVFRLETVEGYSLDLTGNHEVCRVVQAGKVQRFEWVAAETLEAGDMVRLNNHRAVDVSDRADFDRGWLLGSLIGDDTFDLPGRESEVRALAQQYGVIPGSKAITPAIERESESFAAGVLSGLFDSFGCDLHLDLGVDGSRIILGMSLSKTLCAAQRMLQRLGIMATIHEGHWDDGADDGAGGPVFPMLVISRDNIFRFGDVVGFSSADKFNRLSDFLSRHEVTTKNRERFVARVKALVPVGEQEVYDCTIPNLSAFDANGLYVHNCGEILLRYLRAFCPWTGKGGGGQFCNLSAVVMRASDTLASMLEKVEVATWIGALQASFTEFPYLRPAWKQLCDEDRLLGVDITGQCDNPALSQDPDVMLQLNAQARQVAIEAARHLGINEPAAVTCGKPSGNSSQLVDCASGFHARYSPYYIRRVRTDAKDPLTKLLRDSGVPMRKENGMGHLSDEECPVWVVEFPVAAPKGAMLRSEETALQMLERYLMIMCTWCSEKGHNQSITVYVKDHEWDDVGQWVWDHFDEVTGISFLPYSDHKYDLAPYEEIDEATYLSLLAEFPKVDYTALQLYEATDMGQGASELACQGGSCEV